MTIRPIPVAIMHAALRIANRKDILSLPFETREALADDIASAIAAERERCAKIAEGNYDHIGVKTKHDKCPHEKFGWEDCDQCAAAAIRGATL